MFGVFYSVGLVWSSLVQSTLFCLVLSGFSQTNKQTKKEKKENGLKYRVAAQLKAGWTKTRWNIWDGENIGEFVPDCFEWSLVWSV